MKLKNWIWIVVIIAAIVMIYFIAKAQSQQIKVSWNKYDNTGINSDAAGIIIYEIKKDSLGNLIRDIRLGETTISDTTFNFTYWQKPENKVYYYSISAFDTAGNESELDGVDSLDFQSPEVQNILKGVEKIN